MRKPPRAITPEDPKIDADEPYSFFGDTLPAIRIAQVAVLDSAGTLPEYPFVTPTDYRATALYIEYKAWGYVIALWGVRECVRS